MDSQRLREFSREVLQRRRLRALGFIKGYENQLRINWNQLRLEGMLGQLIPVDLQLIFSGTQFGAWSGRQGLESVVLGGVLICIVDMQLICC